MKPARPAPPGLPGRRVMDATCESCARSQSYRHRNDLQGRSAFLPRRLRSRHGASGRKPGNNPYTRRAQLPTCHIRDTQRLRSSTTARTGLFLPAATHQSKSPPSRVPDRHLNTVSKHHARSDNAARIPTSEGHPGSGIAATDVGPDIDLDQRWSPEEQHASRVTYERPDLNLTG